MKFRTWSPPVVAALVLCALSTVARAEGAAPETPAPSADKAPPDGVEHLRIGAVGGVGFPRPLAIEALVKLEQRIGLGLEYSALPAVTVDGVETRAWAVAGDLSFFPFGGAFFLGAKLGRQHLAASTTISVASYGSYAEALSYDEWFIDPRLGFLWTTSYGLSFGIDAGIQIPLSSTSSSTLPTGVMVSSEAVSVASRFGAGVLPTFDLLRVGFLF